MVPLFIAVAQYERRVLRQVWAGDYAMTAILKKKPEGKTEIIDAIITIANDKNKRVCADDEIEWLETKLREVAKLAKRLRALRA